MKKTITIAALLLACFAPSCDFIDPDINIDPNNPLDVSMDLLLPNAQSSLAYALGGDFGRYTSVWTQHHAGVDRQHAGIDIYSLREADVNNVWNSIYATTLKDLSDIRRKAEETDSPHFEGVAKVLTAQTLGTLTDLFGDIPFSDALQGSENLRPSYDSGPEIYETIQRLLTEAVADLQAAESTFSPGASDLIYGGDLEKWIAYAYTLSARYHLHLSEVDQNKAYQNALAAIEQGAISSNAENAVFDFGEAETEANPWYQFETQRGDVVMGKFFLDLMNSIDDPRRPFFATPNADGEFQGAAAGVPESGPAISRMGPYYASINSPVPLATYAETKFIEAEAALPTDPARAANAYNEAVMASLDRLGISDPAFIAAQASETAGSITLEKIITQKYIALYTTQEPYVDWRRTGFPNIQPAAGQTQIPRRFPYPQAERLYNADNYLANVTIFDRLFWDQ